MIALRFWIVLISAAALVAQVAEPVQPGQNAASPSDDQDPDLPRLLCRMALFAQYNSDLPGAEKLVRHGLVLIGKNGSLQTADSAACRTTLAGILEWKGLPQQAQQELELALATRERLFGPDHYLVADTLNRLGIAYYYQGRMAQAERMHLRAVDILRTLAPSSDLASALNNLGDVRSSQGRWKDAEEPIREAIAIWEKLGGPNDPSLPAGLMNLAIVLEQRKQYDQAARLLARARTIDEQAYPANPVRLALDLNASGVLETARKNYREAEDLLRKAVAILEASRSAQHPETGQVLLNLAEVYRLQKKLDQARDAFKRGLAAVTAAWGPDDTRLPAWMEKFAVVLRAQEDFAGAEELEMRATRIRVRALR